MRVMSNDRLQPLSCDTRHPEDAAPPATAMAILAAGLARGTSRVRRATIDESTRALASGLVQLGAEIRLDEPEIGIDVVGRGGHWASGDLDLDCGNHPAATQLLLAACVLGRSRYRLTHAAVDNPSTRSLITAMTDLGLAVHSERAESGPVIQVGWSVFRGGRAAIGDPGTATAACALLLIAPCATGDLFLEMPAWSDRPREVTTALRILAHFGIAVVDDKHRKVIVPAPQAYAAGEYDLQSL